MILAREYFLIELKLIQFGNSEKRIFILNEVIPKMENRIHIYPNRDGCFDLDFSVSFTDDFEPQISGRLSV